jgi:hypothetical protein
MATRSHELVYEPSPARRDAPSQRPRLDESRTDRADRDLLCVEALLWVASVARVVLELVHRRAFGVEATLALVCVVLIPWLVWRSRVSS